jgi:DNA repair photolyase
MNIKKIKVSRALHALKRRGLPYKYDLNVYRGCSHGCRYCYARKSHKYLNSVNFTDDIFIKTNLLDCLEQEIQSSAWNKDIINIGGVCDSYQPIESEQKIMRDILKLMIKNQNPVIISTKSDLIIRDLDLIDQLAASAYVNIAICITDVDYDVAQKIEPGAAKPQKRLNVLKEIKKTRAFSALHFMPIIPFISDSKKKLTAVVQWAAHSEVDYMLSGILYLTGQIRPRFLEFVKNSFPEHYPSYKQLYQKGSADKVYKTKIHHFLNQLRKKYMVNNSYAKFLPTNQ